MDELLYVYWKVAREMQKLIHDKEVNVSYHTNHILTKEFNKFYCLYEWRKRQYNEGGL